MPDGNGKSIHEVARSAQVVVTVHPYLEFVTCSIDEPFQAELSWVRQNIDVQMSEEAMGEFLIAPILKEIWKMYRQFLLLWSHVSLTTETESDVFPGYLFTKRTALGMVLDKPYLIAVAEKRDDEENAWGQCLAALLTAQTINENEGLILHGLVSNGEGWQFGKLQGKHFVRDPRLFTLNDLPPLFAALHYVFEQAKEQVALT